MMFSVLGTQILWYVTRSSGLLALLVLSSTVALGVSSAQKAKIREVPRVYFADLHRSLALFALVLLSVHIFTAIVDPFTHLGWTTAFDPFKRSYRPLYLGLGITAFDIVVAIVVTSLLRKHLSNRLWKAIHLGSYLVWFLAMVHGLGTGTDSHFRFALFVYGLSLGIVAVGLWIRILSAKPKALVLRFVAYALIALVPFTLVLWGLSGPAKAGWWKRFSLPQTTIQTKSTQVHHSSNSSSLAPPTTGIYSDDGTSQ